MVWCKTKKNFTIFGAPWQADAQLINLGELWWVQGIISEDGDVWTMMKKRSKNGTPVIQRVSQTGTHTHAHNNNSMY